jgi:hypothetical protein
MERPTRSRWPSGLVGMLAIVVIVEMTLARHPLRFTETAALSWRLAAEAIPGEAKGCEVACLGDSLVKIGVIPEVIRAGSGCSTYNFAMAQAPAPATYFMLRRLIEAGGRPSAVILDFKPSVLAGRPQFSLRHWQTVLDFRESLELAKESRSVGMLVEIGLGRLLPSFRDRIEIRESVASAISGKSAPTFATNRLAQRNWGMNRGAHLNSSRSPFPGDVGPELHKKLLSDAWKCHRVNAIFVDRLMALAEAHKIPVYWLIPPLPPQLQARRKQSGVDEAYVAYARSMLAKHPSLTILDGRHSGYDDSTFADHTHLNGRGAIAMSRDLATIVGTPGGRTRWVDLPQFSDRPGIFPIEDVDQSRVALETEATRR